MMKKVFVFCFLLLLVGGCSNSSDVNNLAIHNEKFGDTIDSYLYNENGGTVIEVTSQLEKQSNLMENAVKLHVPKAESLYDNDSTCQQQDTNLLYCKTLLTKLVNKPVFENHELQPTTFFDAYFLYDALEEVGAKKDLQNVATALQKISIPNKENTSEYYYYVIMDFILNGTVHEEVKDDVLQIIENYQSSDLIDYEKPIVLHAALVLSRLYELDVDLLSVKDIYSDPINQTSIVLRDEVTFFVHLEVINEMNKQLDEKLTMKILEKQRVFKTHSYSLDDLRNLYVMSTVFSSDDLEDNEVYVDTVRHRLTSLLEEKGDEIKQSYQQSYFLQQASLNVGYKENEDYLIVGDGTCDDVSPLTEQYFCSKFLNVKLGEQLELNNNDLLEKVTMLDMLEIDKTNKQDIVELYKEVLSYSGENFYVVLNIYLNLLIANDIEFDENDFLNKISSYDCELGYCTETGNYDFEMSVYFNNILNLLKEGKNGESL